MAKYTFWLTFFAFLAIGVSLSLAFSDGKLLARGTSGVRSVYCNRPAFKRQPLHFDSACKGLCRPKLDNDNQFFSLIVNASTYWLDSVVVEIKATPQSGLSVTGFSAYAVDQHGEVAGSFEENEPHVIVGTCSEVVTYSSETHGAFHWKADKNRKSVLLKWLPDGYNHGPVRIIAWVVHNHSEVYFLESQPLECSRNGSFTLNLANVLEDVSNEIDLELFEKSFWYRNNRGYQLQQEDPFDSFNIPPSTGALVPAAKANNLRKEFPPLKNHGDMRPNDFVNLQNEVTSAISEGVSLDSGESDVNVVPNEEISKDRNGSSIVQQIVENSSALLSSSATPHGAEGQTEQTNSSSGNSNTGENGGGELLTGSSIASSISSVDSNNNNTTTTVSESDIGKNASEVDGFEKSTNDTRGSDTLVSHADIPKPHESNNNNTETSATSVSGGNTASLSSGDDVSRQLHLGVSAENVGNLPSDNMIIEDKSIKNSDANLNDNYFPSSDELMDNFPVMEGLFR
ncbi:uncharacterized protein LOC101860767 [Aplysia californica]|uniref:Uncharacterized protein LOC101860767 n=1 Tax=Aplysia californica TaxID=6500 RepID=A0ABM0K2M3_APLCA|nr:uncharacterized protein LOC101860767 [Aplysia californica]